MVFFNCCFSFYGVLPVLLLISYGFAAAAGSLQALPSILDGRAVASSPSIWPSTAVAAHAYGFLQLLLLVSHGFLQLMLRI